MNNLVLAYIGDAAYELYIRNYLVSKNLSKVNELQKKSLNYVSAVSQREILEALENLNFFSEDEMIMIKRGRNASGHRNKNTDIVTYKKATGLECLIGHLYLNNINRFEEVMKKVVEIR